MTKSSDMAFRRKKFDLGLSHENLGNEVELIHSKPRPNIGKSIYC